MLISCVYSLSPYMMIMSMCICACNELEMGERERERERECMCMQSGCHGEHVEIKSQLGFRVPNLCSQALSEST